MQDGHWITAATRMELQAAWNAVYPHREFSTQPTRSNPGSAFPFSSPEIWSLDVGGPWFSVTGPGMAQSLMRGMSGIQELKPRAIWQFGIAGSYERSGLQLGETVCVVEECLGDLGLEWPSEKAGESSSFRSMHEQTWSDPHACGPWGLSNPMQDFGMGGLKWKTVRGVTVNEVTGTDSKGRLRGEFWKADVESMEGAALALLGKHFRIPVYQVRTISNQAAHRNWTSGGLELALSQLTRSVDELFNRLQGKVG